MRAIEDELVRSVSTVGWFTKGLQASCNECAGGNRKTGGLRVQGTDSRRLVEHALKVEED